MSNEERLMQVVAGAFAVTSYVCALWFSARAGRTIIPYAVLIALHALFALCWVQESRSGGGSDAAGNGLHSGLIWLGWLVSSVLFGCATWVAFFVPRLLAAIRR